jgi:hypothetical protein
MKGGDHMTKSKRIVAVFATVVALGSLGAVIAHASTGRRAAARQVNRTATTGAAQETRNDAAQDADTAKVGDQNTSDATAEAGPEGADAEGTSDGPGGHEDPAGNVNHEFQGNE